MPGIWEVLQGALSGLGQGMQDMQTRKRQALQDYLSQEQNERLQRQQQMDEFKTKFGMLTPDQDVDVGMLQQASDLGMSGAFQKDPTSGAFRRRASPEDQLTQLRITDAQQDITKGGLDIDASRLTFGAEQKAQAARDAIEKGIQDGSFFSQPIEKRQALWGMANQRGEVPMTMEDVKALAMAKGAPQLATANIYANSRENIQGMKGGGVSVPQLISLQNNLMKQITLKQQALGAQSGIRFDAQGKPLTPAMSQMLAQLSQNDPELAQMTQQLKGLSEHLLSLSGQFPDEPSGEAAPNLEPPTAAGKPKFTIRR